MLMIGIITSINSTFACTHQYAHLHQLTTTIKWAGLRQNITTAPAVQWTRNYLSPSSKCSLIDLKQSFYLRLH